MEITIRQAEREDISNLLTLIEALADFEELEPPDASARERLESDGWVRNPPRFTAFLAEVELETLAEVELETTKKIKTVGYAFTFETYSTFLAKPTLYLEDIFVLPEYREHGVGTALMNHLIAIAKQKDCGRMEWVVLDWNVNAQKFYQKLGAKHLTEWQSYRITF